MISCLRFGIKESWLIMGTIIVLFFIGYIFHLAYKLMDIGFIFISKLVQKVKKDKSAEKL